MRNSLPATSRQERQLISIYPFHLYIVSYHEQVFS